MAGEEREEEKLGILKPGTEICQEKGVFSCLYHAAVGNSPCSQVNNGNCLKEGHS